LFARAKREDSSEKIAPTCPIATSLTRVLKTTPRVGVAGLDLPLMGVRRRIHRDATVLGDLDQGRADEIHVGVVVLIERVDFHERIEHHQAAAGARDRSAQHAVQCSDLPAPALGVQLGELGAPDLLVEKRSDHPPSNDGKRLPKRAQDQRVAKRERHVPLSWWNVSAGVEDIAYVSINGAIPHPGP